jgi:hypothetical protein
MASHAKAASGRRRRRASISLRQARIIKNGPQAAEPRIKKWIPNKDVAFEMFAGSFSATVKKNRSAYGVSEVDVVVLMQRVKAFVDAFRRANNLETRNKKTIGEKKAARKECEQMIREIAAVIRADRNISRGDKIVLGIEERPKKLKRRKCPKTPPVLRYLYSIDAVGGSPGRHVLEYAELFGEMGGKPNDAARLELYVELPPVGGPDDMPQHPCELTGRPWYLRSFSSSPIEVEFPVPMSGPMLVVYWARWADAKGNVGPFSKTCVARVEGWNAGGNGAKSLPPAQYAQLQQVEVKYMILQTPYFLPPAVVKEEMAVQRKRALPAGDEDEGEQRLLDAA